MRTTFLVVLVVTLGCGTLSGCGGQADKKSTDQEKSSFKGGPMPAGYTESLAAKVAEGQKAARAHADEAKQKAMANASAPTGH